jgi:hypothetical protein
VVKFRDWGWWLTGDARATGGEVECIRVGKNRLGLCCAP